MFMLSFTQGKQAKSFKYLDFKDSPDQSHFIFEINVGKSRIRHRTTMNINDRHLMTPSSNDFESI